MSPFHRGPSAVRWILVRWLVVLGFPLLSVAHELRPAYLELKEVEPETYEILWKVPARGPTERLALRVVLPGDAQAVSPPRVRFVNNAHVERSRVSVPGGLAGQSLGVNGLESTLTDVLVRIEHADGASQIERLTPDRVSVEVLAAPGSLEVANTYLVLGIEHILLGIDHLLFVLALLLLVKGWKRLIVTITAFTLAHSITLALATLGLVHVPGPPVEAIIALSIVFVAMEILHVRQGRSSLTERQPWLVAFTFGLLHGLGFAGALSEVGLPATAIPLALLFFNLGVELGQLLFVAVVVGCLAVGRRMKLELPGWMELLPPYAIGAIAMFWVIERTLGF